MGLFSRVRWLAGAKANKLISKAEGTPEQLDFAYQQMLVDFSNVKTGITQVVATKHRMMGQIQTIDTDIPRLTEKAQRAYDRGRPDLARLYLQRKVGLETRKESLEARMIVLEQDQTKLVNGAQQLQMRIQDMRDLRIDLKAQLADATARQQIGQALAGVGKNMEATTRVVEQIRENIDMRNSEALAIDELLASGVFEDSLTLTSNIDRELEAIDVTDRVDAEMAALGDGSRKELNER